MIEKMAMTLFCVCSLSLSAGAAPLEFQKVKVEPDFTIGAQGQYRNAGMGFSPKVSTANKWLMIRVEYTPAAVKNVLPELVSRRNGAPVVVMRGWADDVELAVRVLFDSGLLVNNKPIYGLFTGKTKFWSIKMDGQNHLALMFVPAQLLDRYCVGRNAGSTIHPVTKSNFRVEAVFTKDGTVIGQAFYNVPGTSLKAQSGEFNALVARVPRQLLLEGAVLRRGESPWALHYPDNFDVEKSFESEK